MKKKDWADYTAERIREMVENSNEHDGELAGESVMDEIAAALRLANDRSPDLLESTKRWVKSYYGRARDVLGYKWPNVSEASTKDAVARDRDHLIRVANDLMPGQPERAQDILMEAFMKQARMCNTGVKLHIKPLKPKPATK